MERRGKNAVVDVGSSLSLSFPTFVKWNGGQCLGFLSAAGFIFPETDISGHIFLPLRKTFSQRAVCREKSICFSLVT